MLIVMAIVFASILALPALQVTSGIAADEIYWKLDFYHTLRAGNNDSITGAVFRLPYLVSLPFRLLLRNIAPIPVPQELATETYRRIGTVFCFFGLPLLVRSVLTAFRGENWERNGALRIIVCAFLAFYILNVVTTLQDRHVVVYIPMASVLVGSHIVSAPRTMRVDIFLMTGAAVLLAVLLLFKGTIT